MAKDTFLNVKRTLNLKGRLLDLTVPKVMAIVNITDDSFYSNSRSQSVDEVLRRVEAFMNQGAAMIDLGAYSSRPGAAHIPAEEEMKRLVPMVEAITKKLPETILSIDTFRAGVARETVSAGAHIINDIGGGRLDEKMFDTVAELQVPYILMHMRGTPQTMQTMASYQDIVLDLVDYFSAKVYALRKLGLHDIILDPGFGFAKTLDQNFALLNRVQDLRVFGIPILVGLSRKTMIHKFLETGADGALNGSTVLHTIALTKGASILRVHDPKEAAECIALVEKLHEI